MRHQFGEEIFLVAVDFENYKVSNYGRVKNIITGCIKTPREYGDVFLRKNGKTYRVNPTNLALKTFHI
jgi:hypothetical protein